MKPILTQLITAYQTTLVPNLGWPGLWHPTGACRFYPSCSEYAKLSIEWHGVAKGVWLGAARVMRCHTWAKPGVDLVLNLNSN